MILQGHSGCKLELYENENLLKVRKSSPDLAYNVRLKDQAEKQRKFENLLIKVPLVLSEGYDDQIYWFEMQYIHGQKLSEWLMKNPFEKTRGIINQIGLSIAEKLNSETIPIENSKIQAKLLSLQKNEVINRLGLIDKLNHKLQELHIPSGYCHGDLTLENIIIDKDDNIYFIDFLDSFINSPLLDVAKLYQDFYFLWSFRNNNSALSKIKVEYLEKFWSHQFPIFETFREEINFLYILNLLRIIPYSHSAQLTNKLILEITKVTTEWK